MFMTAAPKPPKQAWSEEATRTNVYHADRGDHHATAELKIVPSNARQTAHHFMSSGEFQPGQWAATWRSLYFLSTRDLSPYEIGRNEIGR